MSSFARRAYDALLRVLISAADPATEPTAAQIYAKEISAILQGFTRDSSGNVYQTTPYLGLAKNVFVAIEDFGFTNLSGTNEAGGATNEFTTSAQGSPGILRQTVTDTTTPDAATVNPISSIVTSIIVGGNEVRFEGRCRTPTAQDGTDQWSDRWGIGDATAAADATDGLYFESDRAVNGDNNVRLCSATGGSRTKTTMGIAPTANVWERWTLILNAAGTSMQGYLDDTATGSPVTATLPTSTASGVWWAQVVKTLGTTNARSVDRDYLETIQIFSPTMR